MRLSYFVRYSKSLLRGSRPGVVKLSPIETLKHIATKQQSLARFGDGELKVALYRRGLRFQRHSDRLERLLNEALIEPHDRLLPASNHVYAANAKHYWLKRYGHYPKRPDAYESIHNPEDVLVLHRRRQQREYQRHWRIVESETGVRAFGEATVFYTGLYIDHYKRGAMEEVLDLFRALFNGRRILFVGPDRPMGGQSFKEQYELMRRIGLRSGQFLSVPETNAFEHSERVLDQVLNTTGYDDVFLQAGPAATAWTYQLAGRIDGRVLDVGSFNTQLQHLV